MKKFESLGLEMPILNAITELGYETPTPIQEKVIPKLLEGNTDLVALAQTGTGKTAAFGLPLLSLIDFNSGDTQALVLCPTRELCMQITRDLQNYAKFIKNANVVAVYGGASIMTQISDIKRGAQIIVATPGRMIDIIGRKRVKLSTVRFAVLDEADEMLNMGFKEDLDEILSETPQEKNTWLFSATMPDEVLRISKTYMTNPVEFTMGTKNQANENIEHVYYVVNSRDRYSALKRIADVHPDIFAIVFCRTKRETQQVADSLIKDGYNADALHGDLSQSQRDHVMKRYRGRTLQLLVATDVAARGIDVDSVTHVINYNLPDELENYTHRSGRTARAGKKGVSILITTNSEVGKIKTIERIIKTKFTKAQVPNGIEVCEKQLFSLVHKIHNVEVNENEIKSFMPAIIEELKDLSKEEIIKRFISTEFNRFLNYYKNAPDLNSHSSHDRNSEGRGERSFQSDSGRKDVVKLFVTLGEMDKLDKTSMEEYISSVASIPQESITYCSVRDSYSFVEVTNEAFPKVMEAFKDQKYGNRRVKVEARQEGERGGSSFKRKSYGEKTFNRQDGKSSSWKRDKNGSSDRGERKSYSGNREKPSYAGKSDRSSSSSSGEKREYSGSRDKGSFGSRDKATHSGTKERRPRTFKRKAD